MGFRCLRSQARLTICLIGLEVAFEEVPVPGVFVGAFPCQDVRSDAVKEPAVVTHHHRTTREVQKRLF